VKSKRLEIMEAMLAGEAQAAIAKLKAGMRFAKIAAAAAAAPMPGPRPARKVAKGTAENEISK